MKTPLSRSFPLFVLSVLSAVQLHAQDKPKYMMPPPEFFRSRTVPGVVIQPGDTISVTSYSAAELTKTVRVREDGKIALPLLQGVQAGGLTPEQLQQALMVQYAKEYTHPDITVDLVAPVNNMVYVTGEVQAGGPKEIRGHMTVAMALASSQVTSKSAKLKQAFLLRAGEAGHYNVYKIDASFPTGTARDIEVVPGDVIFVPKKAIATADDFVDLWVRQLMPATPTSNLSVLFTPGQAATLAAATSK